MFPNVRDLPFSEQKYPNLGYNQCAYWENRYIVRHTGGNEVAGNVRRKHWVTLNCVRKHFTDFQNENEH